MTKQEKSELKQNQFYFSLYKNLPLILAGILIALFFIWGIVDPCVFSHFSLSYSYYGDPNRVYGIMGLPNGFLCWLIWMFIGLFCAVCTYFLLKIVLSHKLLLIEYLKLQNDYLQSLTEKIPAPKEPEEIPEKENDGGNL